jgi:hypothetical protein
MIARAVKECVRCDKPLPEGGVTVPRAEIRNADEILPPSEDALFCRGCYNVVIHKDGPAWIKRGTVTDAQRRAVECLMACTAKDATGSDIACPACLVAALHMLGAYGENQHPGWEQAPCWGTAPPASG